MQKQIRSGHVAGGGARLITGGSGKPLVNQLAIHTCNTGPWKQGLDQSRLVRPSGQGNWNDLVEPGGFDGTQCADKTLDGGNHDARATT